MSRKYSIGLFITTIFIIVLFAVGYRMSYNHALEKKNTQTEQEREVQAKPETGYYIKDTDGYVTVYLADRKTVFEYTTIPTAELPDHLQTELKTGIKIMSLGEVYGFLENYSS